MKKQALRGIYDLHSACFIYLLILCFLLMLIKEEDDLEAIEKEERQELKREQEELKEEKKELQKEQKELQKEQNELKEDQKIIREMDEKTHHQ